MSTKYVSHQFAHPETLDRAERWLRQFGIDPHHIEVHRDGVPWISVIATPEQSAEVEMIFKAAEVNDPDGWPSFWELSRMPHPHVAPPAADPVTDSTFVTARPSPVGWHPPDVADTGRSASGVTEVWDVSTRFEVGREPKVFRR
ncbi:MAG: hypothetical protein LC745_03855 [Planctomycetia bacterium]|nr:hypothetical protein [Planctomycetia bacterium]